MIDYVVVDKQIQKHMTKYCKKLKQVIKTQRVFIFLSFIACLSSCKSLNSFEVPITRFPLDNYSQSIDLWIDPYAPDYDKRLMPYQQQLQMTQEFYHHHYATNKNSPSPWNSKYVIQMLKENLAPTPEQQISRFNNDYTTFAKKNYCGMNYLHYPKQWLQNIFTNMNLKQFSDLSILNYHPQNRGIILKNLYARLLPTNDPAFLDLAKPGQGFPFDILQETAIWVGTPIYIIAQTIDKQWSLILTPHINGLVWVESDGIAKVKKDFIQTWQKHAKKRLVAITRTDTSIEDTKKQYRFKAYVGTVFPGNTSIKPHKNIIHILIPVAEPDNYARICKATISKKYATVMPLTATPHNFSHIISTLLNRPYGWGNMYFYNDCSAELQSLYTPFGIWLPRNSSQQAKIGKAVDKSTASIKERLQYLAEYGRKFTTIIYTEGHVMLYIGTYPNPQNPYAKPIIMTYQNIWSLKPDDFSYRSIIGKSVFLPLLSIYPEDRDLQSLSARKNFLLIYLDEISDTQKA